MRSRSRRLRDALFDSRVSREIRLNIPRTLSKIHSQSAMNALLGGLLEEDRSIRFQAILALEQMARRFSDLKLDREIVESAIVSDVMLYSQRFAIFYVLFANGEEAVVDRASLLRQALLESMERVRERVIVAAFADLSSQRYSRRLGRSEFWRSDQASSCRRAA